MLWCASGRLQVVYQCAHWRSSTLPRARAPYYCNSLPLSCYMPTRFLSLLARPCVGGACAGDSDGAVGDPRPVRLRLSGRRGSARPRGAQVGDRRQSSLKVSDSDKTLVSFSTLGEPLHLLLFDRYGQQGLLSIYSFSTLGEPLNLVSSAGPRGAEVGHRREHGRPRHHRLLHLQGLQRPSPSPVCQKGTRPRSYPVT